GLPNETLRITSPVPALVMGLGDLSPHFEEGAVGIGLQYSFKGPGPDRRVGLHDLPLFGSVFARLEQDAVGNAYLADIVQGAGVEDGLHEGVIHPVAEGPILGKSLSQ